MCCGPTVYNYIHVGNARPAIAFDTVRRYLTYRGYEVKYVLNFTDVDDKIIRTANELGEDVETLTNRYIEAYLADTGALNVQPADVHPRVTDTMAEIIDFIRQLETEGYAYESEGDVYFRTRKFETYGKLSQQSIEDLRAGRVSMSVRKKKTRSTSSYGKLRSRKNRHGRALGRRTTRLAYRVLGDGEKTSRQHD